MSGAHKGRTHRGPSAPWYASVNAIGAASAGSHRGTPTSRAPYDGRHLLPSEPSPLIPAAKRAGVAGAVTVLSIGGVSIAQTTDVAAAGGSTTDHGARATADFAVAVRVPARTHQVRTTETGPAALHTYRANPALLAVPKKTPAASTTTPAATAAPAVVGKHRKAGPAVTRKVTVASTLDCRSEADAAARTCLDGGVPLPDGFAGGLIAAAATQIGKPYVWGGGALTSASGGGFDCSGLVRYAAYQASRGKVVLPHYSGAQIRYGSAVGWDDKQPGDLVFFTKPGASRPHHVAIYVGDGKILQAPHTGDDVRFGALEEFAGETMTVRRLAS